MFHKGYTLTSVFSGQLTDDDDSRIVCIEREDALTYRHRFNAYRATNITPASKRRLRAALGRMDAEWHTADADELGCDVAPDGYWQARGLDAEYGYYAGAPNGDWGAWEVKS